MRILIFRGGALGDFILTLPVLTALRHAWPQAHLTLAARPIIAELARQSGLVDELVDLGSPNFSCFYDATRDLPAKAADFLRSFDIVVSFLPDPDNALLLNWQRASVKRIMRATPQVSRGHAATHFFSALQPLGLSPGITARAFRLPQLTMPAAMCASAMAKLQKYDPALPLIAIHPGSGSSKKNWPLPKFQALAQKIEGADMGQVVWLAGAADIHLIPDLRQQLRGTPLLFDLPLPEVAAILAQCCAYIGNDSGVSHLAAAMGTPCLALFGPTDPDVWHPWGERVVCLRAPTRVMDNLPLSEVWNTLRAVCRQNRH